MSKKIKYNQFGKIMKDWLDEYDEEIYDDVVNVSKDLSSKALIEVKTKSPRDTGNYASGWKKNIRNSKSQRLFVIRINNKNHYRLTHLLEFGHRFVSYGKEWRRKASAQPHITEIELEYKKKFGVELKHKIER